MTALDGPSPFWKELIRHLGKVNRNESWLARRLGVPVQTLSTWKKRNQFRRGCLEQLGETVRWEDLNEETATGLGIELIETKVTARSETHPTEEALRRINREYRIAEKTFTRYGGHTLRVLHTLGENCFYAFSAPTNTPYEFENTPDGHTIAVAIAQALCQGALCLYIRPNEEGVSFYRDTWGFGELVYQKHAVEEIAAFRAQLKSWMVRGEVEGQPKLSAGEADRLLHERLDQCYVTRSPMWMPGAILGMIGWTHARELKARMTIGLPGARFGGMLVYPRYLTLEFRFMRFLRAVVLEACKELLACRDGRTEGQVQLVLPGDEMNVRQIERFYERFSRLLRSVYSIEPGEGALN
jgi:hypothetical protein